MWAANADLCVQTCKQSACVTCNGSVNQYFVFFCALNMDAGTDAHFRETGDLNKLCHRKCFIFQLTCEIMFGF